MRSRNQRSWEITTAPPGKASKRFFQRAQGFHVQIVGRFVEQQHVAAFFQQFGQVQAVAFAAGQILDEFLLIVPLKLNRPT